MAITKEELDSYSIKTGSTFKIKNESTRKDVTFLIYTVELDYVRCEAITNPYEERKFKVTNSIGFCKFEQWLSEGRMDIQTYPIERQLNAFGIKRGTTFDWINSSYEIQIDKNGDIWFQDIVNKNNDPKCFSQLYVRDLFANEYIKNVKVAGHITPEPTDNRYPHKCEYCQSPSWNGGMNNVDCSNPNCPTKRLNV